MSKCLLNFVKSIVKPLNHMLYQWMSNQTLYMFLANNYILDVLQLHTSTIKVRGMYKVILQNSRNHSKSLNGFIQVESQVHPKAESAHQ
jgi:hypothetical protein